MQDWVKNTLTVSWIGLCAGLIGAVTYKLFLQPNSDFLSTGLGAFMGAFFAFLFIRLADFLTRLHKRRLEHYNALVAIERMFLEHLATISDNALLLDDFCKNIREGIVSAFSFKPLTTDRSLYSQIHNLEILNKLRYFNDGVRKLNNDLETLGTMYREISRGRMKGHLKPQEFKQNADGVAAQMETIGRFSERLRKEALELLAMSRLRLTTDMPLSTRYARFFLPGLDSKLDAKQVQEKLERILESQQSSQVNNKN